MRQIYKRLLTTLVLISATQTSSVVQAEGIRLVGPSGEVQSSPRYAEEIERAPAVPANSQPSRFVGPTGENQTLWSIASQLRPSNSVSVQQTLLAIYRINPQAFENQNIHELIPGSRLRIPSLEQVQSATTEQAVAIMKAHEAKLKQPKPVRKISPVQPVEPQSAPEPEKPQSQVKDEPSSIQPKTPVAPKVESTETIEPTAPVPPVNTSPEGEQQVTELKTKLLGSQSELASLEEKNHRLRLMLSEVQNEVETLKSELNDEERIRSEVERLLEEERQRAIEQQRMQPSTLDKILSNGWLVGLAALIPGALLALFVVMLIGQRAKQKEEQDAQQESPSLDPLTAPIGLAAADELEEELNLDEDLFADDESEDVTSKETDSESQDDIFAGLEDEDLDFNLEGDDGEDPFAGIGDDGDFDVGFDEFDSSANGIKVNGEEKALGLEEMERALDEVPSEFETLDDPDFELSDTETNEDDVFAERRAEGSSSEDNNGTHIDQATLDDLFAELNKDDLDLSSDSSSALNDAFSTSEASDNGIDDLLAEHEQPSAETSDSELEQLFDLNNQAIPNTADESDLHEPLEDISGLADNADLDEDSTDLLDELVEFEGDESDDEFDPLNELDSLSGFGSENFDDLDEDSVELLDELLDEDVNTTLEEEVSSELDPFDELIREEEEQQQEDDLLASLGFDDFESNTTPEASIDTEETESIAEQTDNDDHELDSGLDIDALLNENQPQAEHQDSSEQHSADLLENTRKESDDEALSDPEELASGSAPMMSDWDDAFESRDDEPHSDAQGNHEAPSEFGITTQELDDSVIETSSEKTPDSSERKEPEYTPTPNTVENEFGIPQEEDWLLDDNDREPEAAATEAEEEFDFDESDLPEFGEEDALASMADEPELSEPEAAVTEAEEEFDFDESDLPEFGEEDALASMSESSSPESPSDAPSVTLQADNDHDALFEVFAQQNSLNVTPESSQTNGESELSGFAESDMESLLSEKGGADVFEGDLDSDTIDSAGMDLGTMLDVGDDWDGFQSTSDSAGTFDTEEVPEDEREIWSSEDALNQPEIAQENWEQQADLEDFDPKKSQFMTIDELMAQVDQEGGEFEEEDLKLDVGLNEFPDVIGDINDADVDSDAEAAGKLDLAKIYLEMNDPKGAIKLLEEAIVYGEDDIRREAKNLIDSINGR